MKYIIMSSCLIVGIAFSGCTTANSYYTKHENVSVKINKESPSDRLFMAPLVGVAAGYALQVAGNVVANQVAKEQAKYTAEWDGTGEEPQKETQLAPDPITNLINYRIMVQRTATRNENDLSPGESPPAVTKLLFMISSLDSKNSGSYRLKLDRVEYSKCKAKIAKPIFLLGGSPMQNIDVKIDFRLEGYGFTKDKDDKGNESTTPDTKTLLSSTISLKQISPGSKVTPDWVSPIFDIPAKFEIRKLFCSVAVTESSAAPFFYSLADKDHVGDIVDALKSAAKLK